MKYQTTKELYEVHYLKDGEHHHSSIVTTIHSKDIEKIREDLETDYGKDSWFVDPYETYFHKVVLPNIINSDSWIVKDLRSRRVTEVA